MVEASTKEKKGTRMAKREKCLEKNINSFKKYTYQQIRSTQLKIQLEIKFKLSIKKSNLKCVVELDRIVLYHPLP